MVEHRAHMFHGCQRLGQKSTIFLTRLDGIPQFTDQMNTQSCFSWCFDEWKPVEAITFPIPFAIQSRYGSLRDSNHILAMVLVLNYTPHTLW